MTKISLKMDLPTTILVHDYHDFDYIEDSFRQMGLKLKIVEAGFYDCLYVGIVYQKKDADFRKLLKEIKIESDKEADE